ncbi:AEC family transporter [Halarchaeum nitratireducens]|uniref:Malonate transporter n=1 Tax=Halarchaeum nitratireducens TaxID=489913 RepID=A0A830G9B3_9EURY|nr:AEC family transporter [Halarchaeum nitratireducens]GGN09779.1 malonate transporter [Halarchaeum nitratireducens]
MSLASNLLYMFGLLGAGLVARRLGLLTATRADYLTRFAFYVALPALVFASTATTDLVAVFSPRMIAAFVLVELAVAAIAWLVHRRLDDPAKRSVAIVQSYHSNFGFLGLPIVTITLGSVAAGKASVLLGVGALVQIPLTVLVLMTINDAEADLRDEFLGIVRNPVIVTLVVGLGFAAFGLPVPDVAATALGWLADLALPAALLSVAASLTFDADGVDVPTVGAVVALKIVCMPLLAFGVFTLLTSDPLTVRTGVVMLAMPTAISTFIYATQLGGDTRLASANVFVTTVTSLAAVFVLLQFVL